MHTIYTAFYCNSFLLPLPPASLHAPTCMCVVVVVLKNTERNCCAYTNFYIRSFCCSLLLFIYKLCSCMSSMCISNWWGFVLKIFYRRTNLIHIQSMGAHSLCKWKMKEESELEKPYVVYVRRRNINSFPVAAAAAVVPWRVPIRSFCCCVHSLDFI